MSTNDKPSLVKSAALAGVLVAGLVGFSVLPGSGEPADTDQAPVVLPDEMAGLTALDSGDLPQAVVEQLSDPESLAAAQTEAAERVGEVFDAPAAFRIYSDDRAQRLAIVTVLDKAPGLFVPDGPPVAADVAAPSYTVLAVGRAVCAVYYDAGLDAQPTSEPEQTAVSRSHCQLGAGDRTYDMDAQGLGPDAVVDALTGLAESMAGE
jgi:hypothetical protein